MLMVRKKVVCFKEGKQLFGDNGLHSLRDERSDCNRAIDNMVAKVNRMHSKESQNKSVLSCW